MMRTVTIIMAILTCVTAAADRICDMEQAAHWLTQTPLQRVEGVWQLCDCTTRVCIRRDAREPGLYTVTMLESDDCRLSPGDTLGVCRATPDPAKFSLTLRTWGKHTVRCAATLTDSDRALRVERPKNNLKITPRLYLPGFWSVLTWQSDTPASRLPEGMVRLDADGRVVRDIIYL